ncbi:hypothetical protein [Spirosoma luteum]|uniref:hypothetical protein n=1 Tax=Spirosoma luteum TaxID=431553 RepID=UPI00037E5266|nr:hypothetical protein [Spirosoma luteum]
MLVELYTAPATNSSEVAESPISSTSGELPEQEPTLELGDLLGSFDSREEAISSVERTGKEANQSVIDSTVSPFNDYTHVELLTVTVQNRDQSTHTKLYYLVTDEGY